MLKQCFYFAQRIISNILNIFPSMFLVSRVQSLAVTTARMLVDMRRRPRAPPDDDGSRRQSRETRSCAYPKFIYASLTITHERSFAGLVSSTAVKTSIARISGEPYLLTRFDKCVRGRLTEIRECWAYVFSSLFFFLPGGARQGTRGFPSNPPRRGSPLFTRMPINLSLENTDSYPVPSSVRNPLSSVASTDRTLVARRVVSRDKMSDLSLRKRKREMRIKGQDEGRRGWGRNGGGEMEKKRWKPPESFGTVDRFNWLSRSGLAPWQATTSLDSSLRQVQ